MTEFEKAVNGNYNEVDPHASRISYALEGFSRALNDINAEIEAMEKENPGSGQKMRARCESTLLGLINRAGWQV